MIKKFLKYFYVVFSLLITFILIFGAMIATTDIEDPTIFIVIVMCMPFLGLMMLIDSIKNLYN
jgi:hypothetical protein